MDKGSVVGKAAFNCSLLAANVLLWSLVGCQYRRQRAFKNGAKSPQELTFGLTDAAIMQRYAHQSLD